MLKAVFVDAGGVLFVKTNDRGVVNNDVVEFITSHTKYKYGLLSSTDLDLSTALTEYKLTQLFSIVQTTGEIGISKDDPRFFVKAVESLGILPSEAVMIDNDQSFIDTAKKAGLGTITYRPGMDIAAEINRLFNT